MGRQRKFVDGERVKVIKTGRIGKVFCYDPDDKTYRVDFPDEDWTWYPAKHLESCPVKKAFKTVEKKSPKKVPEKKTCSINEKLMDTWIDEEAFLLNKKTKVLYQPGCCDSNTVDLQVVSEEVDAVEWDVPFEEIESDYQYIPPKGTSFDGSKLKVGDWVYIHDPSGFVGPVSQGWQKVTQRDDSDFCARYWYHHETGSFHGNETLGQIAYWSPEHVPPQEEDKKGTTSEESKYYRWHWILWDRLAQTGSRDKSDVVEWMRGQGEEIEEDIPNYCFLCSLYNPEEYSDRTCKDCPLSKACGTCNIDEGNWFDEWVDCTDKEERKALALKIRDIFPAPADVHFKYVDKTRLEDIEDYLRDIKGVVEDLKNE